MKFSASKKTLAAAVASLCALTAVPALTASAANGQGATHASQSRSVDGTSWNFDGTWTDKQGRTGVSHVKVQPQKFWASRRQAHDAVARDHHERGRARVEGHSKVMNLEVKSIDQAGAATSTQALAATCDILHLNLGPLDLDLLGLVIHLDEVVLDIVAESGAGNLLGNLLCAVAGLLDPPAASAGSSASSPPAQPDPRDPERPRRPRRRRLSQPCREAPRRESGGVLRCVAMTVPAPRSTERPPPARQPDESTQMGEEPPNCRRCAGDSAESTSCPGEHQESSRV